MAFLWFAPITPGFRNCSQKEIQPFCGSSGDRGEAIPCEVCEWMVWAILCFTVGIASLTLDICMLKQIKKRYVN
jgi:hypothetical protein